MMDGSRGGRLWTELRGACVEASLSSGDYPPADFQRRGHVCQVVDRAAQVTSPAEDRLTLGSLAPKPLPADVHDLARCE